MFSLHTEKGIDYFLAPPKKLSSRECQCPRIALICMLRRRRRSTRNESDSGSPLDLEASRYRPTWANTLHLYGTFRRKYSADDFRFVVAKGGGEAARDCGTTTERQCVLSENTEAMAKVCPLTNADLSKCDHIKLCRYEHQAPQRVCSILSLTNLKLRLSRMQASSADTVSHTNDTAKRHAKSPRSEPAGASTAGLLRVAPPPRC
eukprot:1140825-Rhodomonas_salina.3